MGSSSSPFILELLPFPSLFYLRTVSFILHPCKLLRKKQTSLGPTEEPFHNFVLLPVIPSIPIVRGYDWFLAPLPLLWIRTPHHVFSCFSHPTPLTELDLWMRRSSCRSCLSSTSHLFLLLTLGSFLLFWQIIYVCMYFFNGVSTMISCFFQVL